MSATIGRDKFRYSSQFFNERNIAIWEGVVAGRTYQSLALEYGITRPRVHQVVHQFMTMAREYMKHKNDGTTPKWMFWALCSGSHAMIQCLNAYPEHWNAAVGEMLLARKLNGHRGDDTDSADGTSGLGSRRNQSSGWGFLFPSPSDKAVKAQ